MARLPTLYIPHGGGPCFFMDPLPGLPAHFWEGLEAYLRGIPAGITQLVKVVLVVSAHWECAQPTVLDRAQHSLLFDYYGFPEHTYQLTYPAPGDVTLAARVMALLQQSGFTPERETQRGLDHGVFIPFKLIYPEADRPIVQLSLLQSLDAEVHLQLGRALASLREEGVLIVASGNSYHNLRDFFSDEPVSNARSMQFDAWLREVVQLPAAQRDVELCNWQQAPGALACHPRSEHLIPLMVAAGAAEDGAGKVTYHEQMLGKCFSGFQFG